MTESTDDEVGPVNGVAGCMHGRTTSNPDDDLLEGVYPPS